MIVSAGASLLLYGLREGREVRAQAGPENGEFPQESTPDNLLTWCAGLRSSRPPDPVGASVEIRPSTRKPATAVKPQASGAQAVVLVSCHEFAGPSGTWMSPEEEVEFMDKTEANGRRAVRLGAQVREPWRI